MAGEQLNIMFMFILRLQTVATNTIAESCCFIITVAHMIDGITFECGNPNQILNAAT